VRSPESDVSVTRPRPRPAVVPPASRRGSPFAELSRQIRQAGLLERRPGYYVWKIAVTGAALAAGWAAFVLVGDSWWQLAGAVWLAAVFTQVGFLGHDAGHRQITGSRRAGYVLGVLLGNLGIGLSYGWWVDKHNRHHAHPNTEDGSRLDSTPASCRHPQRGRRRRARPWRDHQQHDVVAAGDGQADGVDVHRVEPAHLRHQPADDLERREPSGDATGPPHGPRILVCRPR
jgi:fatty acid desaturase